MVMLSVIMRTHNGEGVLIDALRPLIAGAAEGVVRDVVFLDLGSKDATAQLADAVGATMLPASGEPARDTARALEVAHRANWVMLLDQASVLNHGWLGECLSFVERQERQAGAGAPLAAVFRPQHEPERGSADLRRRLGVLVSNRLFSTALLSQGIVIRRSQLAGRASAAIRWNAAEPSIRVDNLLRLRSLTTMARPIEPVASIAAR
jgi:hypothetical protein